jgi:hypothetical protein
MGLEGTSRTAHLIADYVEEAPPHATGKDDRGSSPVA